MELGLRLGDPPPLKDSAGLITTVTATAAVAASATTTTATVGVNTGFCMALGMNSVNGSGYEQDDHDDPGPYDHYEDEEEVDEEILREKGGFKDVTVSSQRRISSMNPPVQLDLLPSAPVPRHMSLPWSSDNGSSEGGSSGNVAAAMGLDVKLMAATEEATSSFRLSYDGRNGRENHKSGLDIGNDSVEVERGGSSRANISDEDEHARKKLRLSKEQSAYLEESFKEHNTLNPKQKHALAEQLNLRPRQVEVWFQNRRARTKLKQTEVDFEYLKRCCETLTDENRRLHKEVQELRALKTSSNPFYMQPPATTLTMCPSCERTVTVPTTISAAAPPPSTTATTLNKLPEQNPNKTTNTVSQRSFIFPSSN